MKTIYEEKYKEALEKAKSKIKNDKGHVLYEDDIVEIFPELAESEDEKIRKWIRKELESKYVVDNIVNNKTADKAFAWLEKQGESKESPTKIQVWDYCSKISREWWQIAMNRWNTLTDEDKNKYNQFIGFNDFSDTLMNITAGALFQLIDTGKLEYEEGSLLLEKPDDTPKSLEVINTINEKSIEEYDVPDTPIKDSEVVTSRMKYIDENLKPIAEFVMDYANWDLRKDEWNHPVATVPLFRVLDALVQKGKQYSEEYPIVDKVEPKFRNGQWIVWQDRCYKVNYNGCGYELVDQNGLSASSDYEDIDKNAHIWDVTKDAKDGDILYFDNLLVHGNGILIYKSDKSSRYIITKYCSVNEFGFEPNSYVVLNDGYIIPATKEQRDKLEKAMLKAGYTWDAEKKELIKNI